MFSNKTMNTFANHITLWSLVRDDGRSNCNIVSISTLEFILPTLCSLDNELLCCQMGVQLAVSVEKCRSHGFSDIIWTQIIHHAIRNGGSKNMNVTAVLELTIFIFFVRILFTVNSFSTTFGVRGKSLLYDLVQI